MIPISCAARVALVVWVLALAGFALLREAATLPNPDVSWLLVAAQRVLSGEVLYGDILETNPPLIVWLNVLPAALASWLGISAQATFNVLVVGVLASISLWCARIMARSHAAEARPLSFLLPWLLLVFSAGAFGQRELLWVAFILPYLLLDAFPSQTPPSRNLRIVAALLAALGCAIKPFFLGLVALHGLVLAGAYGRVALLWRMEHCMIALVQLMYVGAVLLLTPLYAAHIIPALREVYDAYSLPLARLAPQLLAMLGVSLAALLSWGVLARAQLSMPSRLRVVLAAGWVLGACLPIFAQRKDWLNHFYPLYAFAALLLVLISAQLWQRVRSGGAGAQLRFAACCLWLAVVAVVAYGHGIYTAKQWSHPPAQHTALVAALQKHTPPGGRVLSLSFNMQPAFPAIPMAGVTVRASFHQLWPLLGMLQSAAPTHEFPAASQLLRGYILRDFTRFPPDLVILDTHDDVGELAGRALTPAQRDILGFLRRDPEFSAIWKQYQQVDEIIAILPENAENTSGSAAKGAKKPAHLILYARKHP
jgi:hypothetical protein